MPNNRPGWGALLPRFNIPETFGAALSYEGQLHWFLQNWDEVAEYANALEQPTIDVGRVNVLDSNAAVPDVRNIGTDINASLEFDLPRIYTRFADPYEWDFEKSYDVLTVVSDGQGNSYTSRQAVPAHTPLTDTDYWAQTGVYDASLQGIRDDLAEVKTGYCRCYDSDTALVADSANLVPGMICHTIGSEAPGDGGGRWYRVTASYSGDSERLELAGDCSAVVMQPKSLRIDPDIFAGSDSDKLEHAMSAAGNESHATVIITRKYELDRDLMITHRGNLKVSGTTVDERLSFVGIGEGCAIACGAHIIRAVNHSLSYGMLAFHNIMFTAESVIFNTDNLIRVTFDNCIFSSCETAFLVPSFMQSYTFASCTFRNVSGYIFSRDINADTGTGILDDVQMTGCLIERLGGIADCYSVHGCTISQCCIESLTKTPFIIDGDTRSFNIVNNYFEYNVNDNDNCIFDLTGATASLHENLHIDNNRFANSASSVILKLPSSSMRQGNVTVLGNWTSNECELVRPAADYATIYPTVWAGGTPNATALPAVVKDPYYSNLASITPLANDADLNTLNRTGVYYATSSHQIANAPTTMLFYMLHLQRTPSIYFQVVFTRSSMYYRLSGYQWQRVTSSEVSG